MSNDLKGQDSDSKFQPEIHRARFDKLTIYEVSESELDTLERGSPSSIYLNFAVFLLSVAISFTINLLTTTVVPTRTFTIFVVIAVVGYVIGLGLIILWLVNRQSVSKVTETIRKRLPPHGVAEKLT